MVSTKVGGIPEVLPPEMIRMAQPNVNGKQNQLCLKAKLCSLIAILFLAIVSALDDAIDSHLKGTCMSPWDCHQFIHRTYNWVDIASRTQSVYDIVQQQPSSSVGKLLCKYE